ncbi:hypothetical protein B0H13DRAFT_1935730 [Mycena leptocephala]|nr:hypothetical protein B0H13DRAFT_1935730 [Mycena leptocephala]
MPRLIADIQDDKDLKLGPDVEGVYHNGRVSFTSLYLDHDGKVFKSRIVGSLKDIQFGVHKDIWVLQAARGIEDLFGRETWALDTIMLRDRANMPRLTVSQDPWCNPGTIFIEVKASLKCPENQPPFTFGDIVSCEVEMRREDIEIPSGLNMSNFFKRRPTTLVRVPDTFDYNTMLCILPYTWDMYLNHTTIATPAFKKGVDFGSTMMDGYISTQQARKLLATLKTLSKTKQLTYWADAMPQVNIPAALVFGYIISEYTALDTRYWELAVPLAECGSAESALIETAFEAQRANLLRLQGCNSPRDAKAYSFMRHDMFYGRTLKVHVDEAAHCLWVGRTVLCKLKLEAVPYTEYYKLCLCDVRPVW